MEYVHAIEVFAENGIEGFGDVPIIGRFVLSFMAVMVAVYVFLYICVCFIAYIQKPFNGYVTGNSRFVRCPSKQGCVRLVSKQLLLLLRCCLSKWFCCCCCCCCSCCCRCRFCCRCRCRCRLMVIILLMVPLRQRIRCIDVKWLMLINCGDENHESIRTLLCSVKKRMTLAVDEGFNYKVNWAHWAKVIEIVTVLIYFTSVYIRSQSWFE
uniref:Uncharacterized protein n=1 Tax=Glossina austeni TaxID=7395 RepID=A0A1A9UV11_GLOAU